MIQRGSSEKKHTCHTSKNAKFHAPASENANGIFPPSQNTVPATQNGRAQIHWWPQVKMHISQFKNRKKRVWPARETTFETDR